MRKSELIANCRTMEKKYGIATAEYVVGAGSALLVLGLREETDDIDAACGHALWSRLLNHGLKARYDHTYLVYIIEMHDLKIDMHLDPNMMAASSVIIDGIPILSPEELLKQKKRLNRPKDQNDIKALETMLKHKPPSATW